MWLQSGIMDLKGSGDLGSNPYIWTVINIRIEQNRLQRGEMILVRVQPFSDGCRGPRCGVRSQTTTIVVRFGLVSHNAAHYQRQRPFQCRFLQPFFHSRLSLPFSRSLTLSLLRSNAFSLFLLSHYSVCFCQIIPAFQFFSLFILLTAGWSEA